MGRRNLARMRSVDLAWNERRWNDYSDLLADNLTAYCPGDEKFHTKADQLDRAKSFCEIFPDTIIHIAPYIDLFCSSNGTKTCSIAQMTGTMTSPMTMPDGLVIPPTRRRFNVTLIAISRWQFGRIVEQREFLDRKLLLGQLHITI